MLLLPPAMLLRVLRVRMTLLTRLTSLTTRQAEEAEKATKQWQDLDVQSVEQQMLEDMDQDQQCDTEQ